MTVQTIDSGIDISSDEKLLQWINTWPETTLAGARETVASFFPSLISGEHTLSAIINNATSVRAYDQSTDRFRLHWETPPYDLILRLRENKMALDRRAIREEWAFRAYLPRQGAEFNWTGQKGEAHTSRLALSSSHLSLSLYFNLGLLLINGHEIPLNDPNFANRLLWAQSGHPAKLTLTGHDTEASDLLTINHWGDTFVIPYVLPTPQDPRHLS